MALLLILLAPLGAQDDGAVGKVLELNRTGEWAQAAQLAQQSLAAPSASSKSPGRCLLRELLVYARTRLAQTGLAKAALAAFDSLCADVSIETGFRTLTSSPSACPGWLQ